MSRMFKPMPDRPELRALLEAAKNHIMTPEERWAQRRSWVLGEIMLADPNLSRENAEASVDIALADYSPPPPAGEVR